MFLYRLDDPNVKISKGFNFRFAKYHVREGFDSRDLIKAYGILFKVEVTGTVSDVIDSPVGVYKISKAHIIFLQGRRFDFVTLVLKLGSMIALLGIVSKIALRVKLVKGRRLRF